MKKFIRISVCFFSFLSASISFLPAQQLKQVSVLADKPSGKVEPTMWGVFFEDINFAADGGLYAELVKNRSFEFSLPMMGWRQVREKGNGRYIATFYSPSNSSNPHYLELVIDADTGYYGLSNEGFRGMGIKKDMQYNFSVSAKVISGTGLSMKVELLNHNGEVIGASEIDGFTSTWEKYSVSFKAEQTDPKSTMRILFNGEGRIALDMVSLFPADTWKGRKNGMRNDLVQLIADLKPGFVRFPGGCIVEGRDLTNRYQWKTTVGPIDDRKQIINRWNVEMRNRQTPDYFQSFGLGFYEYFLLSEDLGAEPLPILNCGMSCQFNAAEVVPLNELDPYIQDALELIEFANGDASTTWGSLRSSMGHPAPFNLKYIGIGNEQ